MKTIAFATVLGVLALATGASGAAVEVTGTLTGTTEISFGCPGPVSASGPTCNPWRRFPHARFSISRRSTKGIPGMTVLVTSNANARFSVRLPGGTYLVTPLPQHNTRGGAHLTLRVRPGAATTAILRFLGYPQMQ